MILSDELKKPGDFGYNDKDLFKGLKICRLGTQPGKNPEAF